MASSPPNIAQLVVDGLRSSKIDTLFCLPGVQNDDFFNVLFDAHDITPIVTRHEQGAAYMALGAAQVTGRPAAMCVVPGPGMLNAGGALTSAYWAYARVFALVGQIPVPMQGKGFGVLHELADQTAVLRQVTKEAFAITDPVDATRLIQGAFDAVHSGVPRPVSLEVPANLWTQPADGHITTPEAQTAPVDPDAVERATALLAKAERPLIVVGSGAYGASASIIELAEKMQIPVTTRRQGHGVVPTGHPLFVPITVAHEMWPDVDLVIGIGSRIEWPLLQWGYDADLDLIQINIDPEEIDRHGITTVGILADADEACRALIDATEPTTRPPIAADLAGRRAAFNEATAHLEPQRSYTAAIRDAVPDDGALVEDVTQIGFAAHLFYDHLAPRKFLTTGAAGTLGSGTAVAIGAAQASDSPVVGIVGDGGFLFTATELATAVQHDINCNIVVFNDNAFGNVKRIQKTRFGADRTIASDLKNPDLQAFATSFGVRPWKTDTPEGLRDTLREAIDHEGPSLVEVSVDEMPDPWPFFRRPRVRSKEPGVRR
ncbi:MAG: TPP-binding protein [Acidimicrobiales bacterium]|nr:TPP-binding protein [Acidimicrobiales bacterium]